MMENKERNRGFKDVEKKEKVPSGENKGLKNGLKSKYDARNFMSNKTMPQGKQNTVGKAATIQI